MKVYFQYQLSQAQQDEWLYFWENCKNAHPRQHHVFAEIEKAKGRIPLFVIGEENRKIAAIGLFSIRPFFFGNKFSLEAVCLRGPVFENIDDGRDFLLQIISFFKSLRVGSIRISPLWYFPKAEPIESLLKELNFKSYLGHTRDLTALIDLQRSIEDISASFSQSTRREIRRAERNQVIIRAATNIKEGQYFFERFDCMQHERGLTPITFNEFRSMMEFIFKKQDIGILLNAYHGETFLGGLWLARSSLVAHASRYVVVNEVLRSISNLSIGPVLWLHGMIWAKKKGCKLFDMEGSAEATDINSITYEVQKFKKRFNPATFERISEHVYISNHTIQSLFTGSTKIKYLKQRIASLPYYVSKKLLTHTGNHKSDTKDNMPQT